MDARITDEIRRLVAQAGADLAVTFGSAASDRQRPTSDVDIGVTFPRGITPATRLLLDLGDDIERVVARPVDLVWLHGASALLRQQASLGRVLYERTPGLWADFVARALLEYDDVRPHLLRCGWGMVAKLGRTR